jgi:hypothetical protein
VGTHPSEFVLVDLQPPSLSPTVEFNHLNYLMDLYRDWDVLRFFIQKVVQIYLFLY